MERFYFPRFDAETFLVDEVSAEFGQKPKRRTLRGTDLLASCIRAGPVKDREFFLAYAGILSGERYQRTAIRRKVDRKTRNIELRVETALEYLNRFLDDLNRNESKAERKRMMQQMDEHFAEAASSLRQQLGLGNAQPSRFSYRVPEDAVAATGNPALQQKLRTLVTQGDLSEQNLLRLQKFLEKDYPQETKAVMAAVNRTQSREHLSAISLRSSEDKLLVSIVNAQGERLTLLEHKFRDLLKHPNSARLLHTYLWENHKNKEVDFIFSGDANGMVVGRLDTAGCLLDVLRLDPKSHTHHDRARFVLDFDYLCSLYLVLQHMREDRERFDRLLEQAEASVGFDPFTGVLDPHYL